MATLGPNIRVEVSCPILASLAGYGLHITLFNGFEFPKGVTFSSMTSNEWKHGNWIRPSERYMPKEANKIKEKL